MSTDYTRSYKSIRNMPLGGHALSCWLPILHIGLPWFPHRGNPGSTSVPSIVDVLRRFARRTQAQNVLVGVKLCTLAHSLRSENRL